LGGGGLTTKNKVSEGQWTQEKERAKGGGKGRKRTNNEEIERDAFKTWSRGIKGRKTLFPEKARGPQKEVKKKKVFTTPKYQRHATSAKKKHKMGPAFLRW